MLYNRVPFNEEYLMHSKSQWAFMSKMFLRLLKDSRISIARMKRYIFRLNASLPVNPVECVSVFDWLYNISRLLYEINIKKDENGQPYPRHIIETTNCSNFMTVHNDIWIQFLSKPIWTCFERHSNLSTFRDANSKIGMMSAKAEENKKIFSEEFLESIKNKQQ